jgi:hypothetical protein
MPYVRCVPLGGHRLKTVGAVFDPVCTEHLAWRGWPLCEPSRCRTFTGPADPILVVALPAFWMLVCVAFVRTKTKGRAMYVDPMRERYGATLTLLVRHPGFRRLTAAGGLSLCGLWIASVSLAFYAYSRDGLLGAGAVYAARTLAGAICVSPAAAICSRLPARTAMVAGDCVRAGLLTMSAGMIALHAPVAAPVVLGALVSIASAASTPVEMASVPLLVDAELTVTANATITAVESVGSLIGPAIGASVALAAGCWVAMAVAAVACACAMRIRTGLPSLVPAEVTDRRLTAGWREAASNPLMRVLLLLTVAELFVFGGLNVIVLRLADQRFHSPDAGGFLLVAFAFGGLAAAALSSRLVSANATKTVLWAPVILAAGLAMAAVAPAAAIVPAALIICGYGLTLAEVADITVSQRLFQGHALTRVTGVTLALAWSSSAFGAVATPLLVTVIGVTETALALGVLLALATSCAALIARGVDRPVGRAQASTAVEFS